MSFDNNHLKYCVSDKEKLVLQEYLKLQSQRKVATKLSCGKGTVQRALKAIEDRASLQGYAPDNDMVHETPSTHFVKGTSTLYKNGKPSLQWVKTNVSMEQQQAVMASIIEAMKDDIKPCQKSEIPEVDGFYDAMAVYPIGDLHVGMMSWGEETGQDWDLSIVESKMAKVFSRLLNSSPSCEECAIINLGDWYHADNMSGVTERSKHSLDLDGRYAKMVRVGVRIMRSMIDAALKKHNKVRVINAIGNHDDTGAMFLSIAMEQMYINDDRVFIDSSPTPYHYIKYGKVLIGVHHGHSTKTANLPMVMATDKAKDWGDTDFRYWYTGHIHHDSKKEYSGCMVESFRTIAAKDAYATWHGCRAGQDSKMILIDKNFGEIERHTVNIGMV